MLESLLDYNSFGFYNIELARILGVDISIYLSVLISVNNKAIKKEKLDADGFFAWIESLWNPEQLMTVRYRGKWTVPLNYWKL